MMTSPNLALPYLMAAQAQKHVTVNEALRLLDALTHLCIVDRRHQSPPPDPVEGACYIVADSASGLWAGHDGAIACWQDGAWAFAVPRTGWCAWSIADAAILVFDGGWRSLQLQTFNHLASVGINASADTYNRLALRSNAALFTAVNSDDSGNGNMQIQISKQAVGNTASLYFSNNFSGRAEFGLIGSDAFKLKVSPDGANWSEALAFDASDGAVSLPGAIALTGVVSSGTLLADLNDYNPVGLARAAVLKLASDAPRNITGLAGGREGRVLVIVNAGGNPLTFIHNSTASVAGNRMLLGGNVRLNANQSLTLRYDGAALRWQCIAASPGVSVT